MKQIFSKILFGVLSLTVLFSLMSPVLAQTTNATDNQSAQPAAQTEDKQIIFFYGQGCPHCAKVEAYFEKEGIYDKYPIVAKEIYFNDQNRAEYSSVMDKLGVPVDKRGVPALVLGDKLIVGDAPIIDGFKSAADAYLGRDSSDPADKSQEKEASQDVQQTNATTTDDKDSSGQLSLWMVVSASAVDAINPCAFAVLVILLTTVLAKKDRKKAMLSGLAFSTAIFISYILMGLGVYAALGSVGAAETITKVVGVLAIILGLLNLRNYFWYDKGGLIEVPKSWRPKMTKIVESVTSPIGAMAIGFAVSLFLLPCTSGPYIVILGLLAKNTFDMAAVGYLILYNLIFVSPMVIITWLVYKGLSPEKVEMVRQQNLERLHLIAAIVLIAIGAFVLFVN